MFNGNLWYMFAAWWMFLIGLTVTGGLGMAGSGNDDFTKRPSQSEWTSRRLTLLGIVIHKHSERHRGLRLIVLVILQYSALWDLLNSVLCL